LLIFQELITLINSLLILLRLEILS